MEEKKIVNIIPRQKLSSSSSELRTVDQDANVCQVITENHKDPFIEGEINLNEKLYIGIDYICGNRNYTGYMNNILIENFENPCNVYFTNVISDYGVVMDPTLNYGTMPIFLQKDLNEPFFLIIPAEPFTTQSNPSIFFPNIQNYGTVLSDSIQDGDKMYISFTPLDVGNNIPVDILISGKPYRITFYLKNEEDNVFIVHNAFIPILIPEPCPDATFCNCPVVPDRIQGTTQIISSENTFFSNVVRFKIYQTFNFSENYNGLCLVNTDECEIMSTKGFYNNVLNSNIRLKKLLESETNKTSSIQIDQSIIENFNEDDIQNIQFIIDEINNFNIYLFEKHLSIIKASLSNLNRYSSGHISNSKILKREFESLNKNFQALCENIRSDTDITQRLNILDKIQGLNFMNFHENRSLEDKLSSIKNNSITDFTTKSKILLIFGFDLQINEIINFNLSNFSEIIDSILLEKSTCVRVNENISRFKRYFDKKYQNHKESRFLSNNFENDRFENIKLINSKLSDLETDILKTQFNLGEKINQNLFAEYIDLTSIMLFTSLKLCKQFCRK